MTSVRARAIASSADASLAISAVALIAWIVVAASSPWVVDDAFIVARYGAHLARDGVLAFNVGDAPVEGFTSPLAVAWAALAVRLGLDPIAALQALGATATIATAPLVWLLGRELRITRPAPGLAAFAYAAMGEHVTHARSGLETAFAVAVTTATLWTFSRALSRANARLLPLALVGVLAAVTRPEAAAPALAAVAIVAWRRRRDRRALGTLAGAFAVPVAALLAARVAWFHALLPNTYHAKVGPFSTVHARELSSLFDDYALPVVLAAAAAVVTARLAAIPAPRVSPRVRWVLALALVIVVADVGAYARALLIMDYARRFAFHATPALVVLVLVAAGAAARVIRALAARSTLAGATTATCLALGLVASASTGATLAERYREADATYAAILARAYIPAAAVVADALPPDATLAVYPDAGVVPWLTGMRTIDFGRLNDAYLARGAHSPEDVAAYFFAVAPDALVVAEPAPSRLFDEGAERIAADPRFAAGYELRARFETERGAALRVYLRRAR